MNDLNENTSAIDERFVLAFHGLTLSPESIGAFFALTTKWFNELGYPPNKLSVDGEGFSGRVAGYKRQSAKLVDAGFANIESFYVFSCEPKTSTPMIEYTAAAGLMRCSNDDGVAIVSVPSDLCLRSDWRVIAESVINILGPNYGYGYLRRLRLGPDAYSLGMSQGIYPTDGDSF